MSGQSINIDSIELQRQIASLRQLVEEVETEGYHTNDIMGQGYMISMMQQIDHKFVKLDQILLQLMRQTIELLENVSDGFIETDEEEGEMISQLVEEVSSVE